MDYIKLFKINYVSHSGDAFRLGETLMYISLKMFLFILI
jgi:hypothetical protein